MNTDLRDPAVCTLPTVSNFIQTLTKSNVYPFAASFQAIIKWLAIMVD